jgi:phosphoenolpyruvate phosphomutase
MEAHSGLSARIVEETGFGGIWASGLSISAALGVRDCNEASWTQVLEVVEFMHDAAPNTPILVDGDTGFGNFNNVRRLVRKLEQRHISGVCLEDKVFPKRNSFVKGKQEIADPIEFAGKIRAAKDSQSTADFSVIARVEGFIAGLSLDEVLSRADRYYDAGADAVLVHSKRNDANEILAFAKDWDRPCPLVIVPTTYGDTPTAEFAEAGVSAVIWANHIMRASISAMQTACNMIFKQQSIRAVEERIAPLSEVFRLQRTEELAEAESRYLPTGSDRDTPAPLPVSEVLEEVSRGEV